MNLWTGAKQMIKRSRWGALNVLLIGPMVAFWLSITVYLALGTDYLIDVVVQKMGATIWGQVMLIILTAIMPAAGVWLNGKRLKMPEKRWAGLSLILGGMLAAGALLVLRYL